MCLSRTVAAFAALTLGAIPVPGQEEHAAEVRQENLPTGAVDVVLDQEGAAKARFTLWVMYRDEHGAYLDHAQYFADLQSRFSDQGAAIAVVMPKASAIKLAASKPRFVVAAAAGQDDAPIAGIDGMASSLTQGTSGPVIVMSTDLDHAVDSLQQCLSAGIDAQQHQQDTQVLQTLLANVADGGEYGQMAERSLKAWPRSGRAHGCMVLFHWWCKGDLEAAGQAIDKGIAALSNEAVPMTYFADLVLRGDRNDPAIARKMAMAMAPVAAGAPKGVRTQLVYLRALLRAGQDRVAGRVVATLPKRIGKHAVHQLMLAETLMEADNPLIYRDLAERAIKTAEDLGGTRQWVYGARHKVLKRCGDDEAAAELMVAYRKKNISSSGLNNDAWYLVVRPQTMGRFDTLALAQCEEMLRVEGDGIDYGSMDTVALAHFVNGLVDKAVEMQTTAAQGSNNDPVYIGRLNRYKATQKLLVAAARKQKPK